MFQKKFHLHYKTQARTLDPEDLGTKASGWVITGKICDDYYQWVRDFEAVHAAYGRVWGSFEDIVYADSEEGFNHFYENHHPHEWDYWDI